MIEGGEEVRKVKKTRKRRCGCDEINEGRCVCDKCQKWLKETKDKGEGNKCY